MLRKFVGLFADEIALVHRAYALTLTDPGRMPSDTLARAVELASRLTGLLREQAAERRANAPA